MKIHSGQALDTSPTHPAVNSSTSILQLWPKQVIIPLSALHLIASAVFAVTRTRIVPRSTPIFHNPRHTTSRGLHCGLQVGTVPRTEHTFTDTPTSTSIISILPSAHRYHSNPDVHQQSTRLSSTICHSTSSSYISCSNQDHRINDTHRRLTSEFHVVRRPDEMFIHLDLRSTNFPQFACSFQRLFPLD